MKMRVPILFIFLLGGGLLIWFFSGPRREAVAPAQPYWAEQIGDLSELGRYKHASAAEYNHFAATALAENQPYAAQLFHALAQSAQVHELNCADAVRRLGGHYTPPSKVIVFRSSTQDNLKRAFDDQVRHYDYYRSGCIERAIKAGNRYAARTVIRIAGGDMRHTELLECFILHPDSSGYAVCPTCGNLFRTAYCDRYCPFCQTPEKEFIRFE